MSLSQKIKSPRWIIAIVAVITLVCICSFFLIWAILTNLSVTKSGVNVADLILTDNLDQDPIQPKTLFSTETEAIYAIVSVESDQSIPITIRWYYVK